MNHLLGIEHDKDVRQIPPPPQDDFDLYEDDLGGPGPSIHPMTPSWENLRCEWNYRLYELFIEYLEAPAPDGHGIHLNDENHTEIEGMFFERLYRLKREIIFTSPKPGERHHQVSERVAKKKKDILERQRPNTRRKQVRRVR
jgi:hypothetical protein